MKLILASTTLVSRNDGNGPLISSLAFSETVKYQKTTLLSPPLSTFCLSMPCLSSERRIRNRTSSPCKTPPNQLYPNRPLRLAEPNCTPAWSTSLHLPQPKTERPVSRVAILPAGYGCAESSILSPPSKRTSSTSS